MSTNTSPLNPDADPNILEMSEEQIAPIDLSNWPKKIRVRLRRSNAYVQIQHVGKMLILKQIADYRFGGTKGDADHDTIAVCAFETAASDLDAHRMLNRLYRSAEDGVIEIAIDHKTTGAQAMVALDNAITTLLTRANEMLATIAKGISFTLPDDPDWG